MVRFLNSMLLLFLHKYGDPFISFLVKSTTVQKMLEHSSLMEPDGGDQGKACSKSLLTQQSPTVTLGGYLD